MATIDYSQIQWAAGNDNAAGLVAVNATQPSGERKFPAPKVYTVTDDGLEEIRGNGLIHLNGFGAQVWLFGALTFGHYDYLVTTFCPTSRSGLVTVRTYYSNTDTPANYNAVMLLPKRAELNALLGGFSNVPVRITRLVAL